MRPALREKKWLAPNSSVSSRRDATVDATVDFPIPAIPLRKKNCGEVGLSSRNQSVISAISFSLVPRKHLESAAPELIRL